MYRFFLHQKTAQGYYVYVLEEDSYEAKKFTHLYNGEHPSGHGKGVYDCREITRQEAIQKGIITPTRWRQHNPDDKNLSGLFYLSDRMLDIKTLDPKEGHADELFEDCLDDTKQWLDILNELAEELEEAELAAADDFIAPAEVTRTIDPVLNARFNAIIRRLDF